MTEKLYYLDSHTVDFSATVVERVLWDKAPAVILDRTAFYPSSGGQPADHGFLNRVEVIDVLVREEDDTVVHILREPLDAAEAHVEGSINWERRFDHMQQHSGQHILSAAFEKVLNIDTVGFHLGTEISTVDIATAHLDLNAIIAVENLSNQIVWENRPVTSQFVSQEELASLDLRRDPVVEGQIRIVNIQGFDSNPCCGTHVSHSGEIGLVKISRIEHRGDTTRVEFLCGKRAFEDYRAKNNMVGQLSQMLSVGYWELDATISRMQTEGKAVRRDLRRIREELLEMESQQLAQVAVDRSGFSLVARVWTERAPNEIRALAQALAQSTRCVALLACITEGRAHLCFSRSNDLDLDVAWALGDACLQLGGKGGGRPHLAQGSAPCDDISRVESVITHTGLTIG
jgi:alanyl-tRNA synthetase